MHMYYYAKNCMNKQTNCLFSTAICLHILWDCSEIKKKIQKTLFYYFSKHTEERKRYYTCTQQSGEILSPVIKPKEKPWKSLYANNDRISKVNIVTGPPWFPLGMDNKYEMSLRDVWHIMLIILVLFPQDIP